MKLYDIYKSVLTEEFVGNELYGYHATSRKNIDSIADNGFKTGDRQMQGKGIYSFYNLDEAIRYAIKGEINDVIIIKYKITKPRSLIYLNMDIAKQYLGSNYSLKSQVDEKYWDYEKGLDAFIKGVRMAYKRDITLDGVIDKLNQIENNNSESNQRTFWAHMIPSSWNNNLNILLDGNYGVEIRVNRPDLMYVLGYYDGPNFNELKPLEKDPIPNTPEYDELRKWRNETGKDIYSLKTHFDEKQAEVRNNREYDYYNDLINKIRKI
jgi:hypothetical protein